MSGSGGCGRRPAGGGLGAVGASMVALASSMGAGDLVSGGAAGKSGGFGVAGFLTVGAT